MGFAIARAAAEAGADVTLIAGPVALGHAARRAPRRRHHAPRRCTPRRWPRRRRATSSSPPRRSPTGASPSVATRKIKKTAGPGRADLRAGREPRHPGRGRGACRRRRSASASPPRATTWSSTRARSGVKKNVPLIVANLGPATFGQDDNALTLIDADGARELARADKLTLARQLVAEIAARLAARAGARAMPRRDARRRPHPRPAHGRAAAGLRHRRQRRPRPARLPRRAARAAAGRRRS